MFLYLCSETDPLRTVSTQLSSAARSPANGKDHGPIYRSMVRMKRKRAAVDWLSLDLRQSALPAGGWLRSMFGRTSITPPGPPTTLAWLSTHSARYPTRRLLIRRLDFAGLWVGFTASLAVCVRGAGVFYYSLVDADLLLVPAGEGMTSRCSSQFWTQQSQQ